MSNSVPAGNGTLAASVMHDCHVLALSRLQICFTNGSKHFVTPHIYAARPIKQCALHVKTCMLTEYFRLQTEACLFVCRGKASGAPLKTCL